MPSKSKKQARFMAAAAHNPRFAKKAGISQRVAREFHEADRGRRYAEGGKVGKLRRISDFLKNHPDFQIYGDGAYGENSPLYEHLIKQKEWDPEISDKDLSFMIGYGEGNLWHWKPESNDPLIMRMDELIKKHGIRPKGYVTYRGLELPEEQVDSFRSGDVLRSSLPSSTSVDRDTAEAFAHLGTKEGNITPTLVRIAPSERLALPIPPTGQSELVMPSGDAGRLLIDKLRPRSRWGQRQMNIDAEVIPHPGFAEGGEVSDDSFTDTYIKRPLAGLASMWGGIDPETGEFVNPAWHNIKRQWNADERRKQGLPPQKAAKMGLIESAKALPGLVYGAGQVAMDHVSPLQMLSDGDREMAKQLLFGMPDWVAEAEANEGAIHKSAQDALGLDDPHGFAENLMDSAGVMAGQMPLPGATSKKLAALKDRGPIGKAVSAGVEFLSPTIDPKLRNYAAGATFGGVLGGGIDYVADAAAKQEQQSQWMSEAIAEILAEDKAAADGDEASDDEALAELGYAEGGRVGKARALIGSLRKDLEGVEDVALRKAKLEQALQALKGETTALEGIDKVGMHTAATGLADAAADLVPERRRQRFGDYEQNLLRLLENTAPRLVERRKIPRTPMTISNMAGPPALHPSLQPGPRKLLPHEFLDRELGTTTPQPPIPKQHAGHGLMSPEDFDRLVLKKAEGGAVEDPRGSPLSQEWFENYGSGPEHLFLGDRTVKLPEGWAPQGPSTLPPGPVQRQPDGSWLPVLGAAALIGRDLWRNRRQGQETGPLGNLLNQGIEEGIGDTEANNQRDFNRMPMPHLNDDGTASFINPRDPGFWDRIDDAARDTSNTDAWVRDELDQYGDTHDMPTAEYDVDPTLLDRTMRGGSGAFDLYVGSQRGGVGGAGQVLSGASNLGEAVGLGGDLLGNAGTVGSMLEGIGDGSVEGYLQAGGDAVKLARAMGHTGPVLDSAGQLLPVVGQLFSAYQGIKAGNPAGYAQAAGSLYGAASTAGLTSSTGALASSGLGAAAPLAAAGFLVADLINAATDSGESAKWNAVEDYLAQNNPWGLERAGTRGGQFLRFPNGAVVRWGNNTGGAKDLRDAILAGDMERVEQLVANAQHSKETDRFKRQLNWRSTWGS